MDGKGREGTYNCSLTTTGAAGGQGIGHRGAAAPLRPAGAARDVERLKPVFPAEWIGHFHDLDMTSELRHFSLLILNSE